MTGIDGATTVFPFHDRAEPMDRPLPEALATLKAEYFVEWQVADFAQLECCTPSPEAHSL